ncbi:hypothetical protein HYO29_03930 [Vibrio parahaemolyticus]|nr:hypothetical protein [Vibrio parahaemolyticus]MBM4938037.1 hypothetical protein [Vibrio parahaemolyticus]
MFKVSRIQFAISLYIELGRHSVPKEGLLCNIHDMYDKEPNPLLWSFNITDKESEQKKFGRMCMSVNSTDTTIIGCNMSNFGTLLEAEGCYGVLIKNCISNNKSDVTLIDAKNDIFDCELSENLIYSESHRTMANHNENHMDKYKPKVTFIKSLGKVEGSRLERNSVEGYDQVSLIDAVGDVKDTTVVDNRIYSSEALKILEKLQTTADGLDLPNDKKDEVNRHVNAIKSALGTDSFVEKYKEFSEFLSSHITIMTPLAPFLAQLSSYL